MLRINKLQF